MIACSGIDSTIKIFGPGGASREREHASKGVNVANPSGSVHSSLRFGGRRRRAHIDDDSDEDQQATYQAQTDEDEAAVPARGLRSRRAMEDSYRIMQGNDEERRNGQSEAYISVSDMENLDLAMITRLWLLNQFRAI